MTRLPELGGIVLLALNKPKTYCAFPVPLPALVEAWEPLKHREILPGSIKRISCGV